MRSENGQSVHAAFLNIIRALDAGLSQRLHDENRPKFYTTSPLWADQPSVKMGQDVYARFAFLDPSLAALFVEQFLLYGRNYTLHIDGVQLAITDIYATPEGHPRAGKLPLIPPEETTLFSRVTLNFITPTAFSRRNGKHVEYRTDMSPELVWKYARQKWGESGGSDPGQVFEEWVRQYCIIENSSLTPQYVDFKKFHVNGVRGRVAYALRDNTPQDDFHRLWCYLTHFMSYSSVGYKTTMGMGQVMPYVEEV
jgi:CRISPR-associated endoribonuclease Cas6